MSALINFKPHAVSPALSTTATTIVGWFNLLNNYIVSLAGNADCHWEVASFSVAANPYYLVLKRKSAAAGRILFMGTTAAPGAVYNDAMRNYSWSAAGIRMAYFPEATSDVPANLLTNAGDVFTNPGNCTGMCYNHATYIGTDLFKLWSSEAGIILRIGTPAVVPSMVWVAGEMMDNPAGVAIPCAGASSALITPMLATPLATTQGFAVRLASGLATMGLSLETTIALLPYLRDLALKKLWFYPYIFGTLQYEREHIAGYTLRQIGRGPAPLVGSEIIYLTGPVEAAFALADTTSQGTWIVNDIV